MGGHSLQGDRRLITPAQQVESILIKDIVIPPELQSSLSAAAQQRRLGEAKVLAASAEVDAARLMREAADILSSPAALQIRQLESLQVR
jgi:erythrocyte band 7 integral membrane protein